MKTVSLLKLGGLALTVSLLSACGQPNSPKGETEDGLIAGNIVGGANLSVDVQKQAGVVGLVIVSDAGMGTCTGSLISKRIVLTAAHCLDESEGAIRKIYAVFTNDVSKATRDNVIAGVTGKAHESFAPSVALSWNDVALIKLAADAPADFKLVRLPSRSTQIRANVKATQMGFGKAEATRTPATDTSGVFRGVSGISLLRVTADGKELHFDETNKGSCNGDSGGPAYIRESDGKLTQIGVNSRGTLRDSCLGTGIYTNVAAHMSWIRSTSANLMAVAAPSPATPAPTAPAAP
jgi:secreted trypsin-like serine protease